MHRVQDKMSLITILSSAKITDVKSNENNTNQETRLAQNADNKYFQIAAITEENDSFIGLPAYHMAGPIKT